MICPPLHRSACISILLVHLMPASAAEPVKTIELWPNGAPGEMADVGDERDMTKPSDGLVAGKPVIRLGNVSKPTITLYRPPSAQATGTAVLVCPGGGYNIL